MYSEQRADALPNSPTLLQLWDALGSKLFEAAQGQLPSKQRVVGSNPSRDATKLTRVTASYSNALLRNKVIASQTLLGLSFPSFGSFWLKIHNYY